MPGRPTIRRNGTNFQRWHDIALEESRALRLLLRAHGRLPRTQPVQFDVLDRAELKRYIDRRRRFMAGETE